jgi:uncharacterized tellurite resistance protein B-like protein
MFKELIGKLFEGPGRSGFAADDHRVAAAALLLRTVGIDGLTRPDERAKVTDVVRRGFGLDARSAQAVLSEAERRDREAVDISDFTSVLQRALSPEGRTRIVEMLWEVSFADGNAHEFEESVIDRVAHLLDVPDQDIAHLRTRAAGEAGR